MDDHRSRRPWERCPPDVPNSRCRLPPACASLEVVFRVDGAAGQRCMHACAHTYRTRRRLTYRRAMVLSVRSSVGVSKRTGRRAASPRRRRSAPGHFAPRGTDDPGAAARALPRRVDLAGAPPALAGRGALADGQKGDGLGTPIERLGVLSVPCGRINVNIRVGVTRVVTFSFKLQ